MTVPVKLPPPFTLVSLDSVDSTNEEARRLAEGGAADGTVVWALEQTAGRGRRGRTWHSPKGNLYFSLLLRPGCEPSKAVEIGFMAANILADTVMASVPAAARVTCKWPNDVLVEGRKIAGLLLESESSDDGLVDWLVVGTGLNVISHPKDCRFPATSLKEEGANELALERILETYCQRFLAGLVTWRRPGFAAVRRAWLRRAHGLGKPLSVRLGEQTVTGIFKDMDGDGALVLVVDGRERRITAGEVFFDPFAV